MADQDRTGISDLDEAAVAREAQREAAQRDRQAALREHARDAAAYKDELLEAGFSDVDALRLVEHMLGWYWEGHAPWDS